MSNQIKILKFHKYKDGYKTAILHRFNASIRVLDGDNKEYFFNELSNAIKFLLNDNYIIELNI